jgi:hypothetical protein
MIKEMAQTKAVLLISIFGEDNFQYV